MKSTAGRTGISLVSTLILIALGKAPARSQELPLHLIEGPAPKARLAPPSLEELSEGKRVAGFGTSIPSVEAVPAIAFQEAGQPLVWEGEFFRTSAGGNSTFLAPIHLPSGVIIDFVAFAVCGSATGR